MAKEKEEGTPRAEKLAMKAVEDLREELDAMARRFEALAVQTKIDGEPETESPFGESDSGSVIH